MPVIRQAYIGAGANLGDRPAALRGALAKLQALSGITALEASPIYETDPVGLIDQPAFLNLVVGVETTLTPDELLAALQRLEQEAGRERSVRWGPRTLDLDLLLFEGETRSGPKLQLPHPRLFEREFVTVPLRDVLDRPRFRRDCWSGLRQRLDRLPGNSPKVRPWPEDRG